MKKLLKREENLFIISPGKKGRNVMVSNIKVIVSTLKVLIFVKLKLDIFVYILKQIIILNFCMKNGVYNDDFNLLFR